MGSHWLRAMTIENSKSGCGLSQRMAARQLVEVLSVKT